MSGFDSGTVSAAEVIASGGITGASLGIGPAAARLSQIAVYAPWLAPGPVGAAGTGAQSFTVPGLTPADLVLLNGPPPAAGCVPVHARASAINTLEITFANLTGGALTPAAGVYRIITMRS
jgi:hypothetical protein